MNRAEKRKQIAIAKKKAEFAYRNWSGGKKNEFKKDRS